MWPSYEADGNRALHFGFPSCHPALHVLIRLHLTLLLHSVSRALLCSPLPSAVCSTGAKPQSQGLEEHLTYFEVLFFHFIVSYVLRFKVVVMSCKLKTTQELKRECMTSRLRKNFTPALPTCQLFLFAVHCEAGAMYFKPPLSGPNLQV